MRQYRLSACLLLTLCLFGGAAAQDVKYRAIEDVVYGYKDGLGLTMDVLIPETKPKNIGVIFIVSASWRSRKNTVHEEEERQHDSIGRGSCSTAVTRCSWFATAAAPATSSRR